MIVCDRFDANPRVGLRNEELEPYKALKAVSSVLFGIRDWLPRESKLRN